MGPMTRHLTGSRVVFVVMAMALAKTGCATTGKPASRFIGHMQWIKGTEGDPECPSVKLLNFGWCGTRADDPIPNPQKCAMDQWSEAEITTLAELDKVCAATKCPKHTGIYPQVDEFNEGPYYELDWHVISYVAQCTGRAEEPGSPEEPAGPLTPPEQPTEPPTHPGDPGDTPTAPEDGPAPEVERSCTWNERAMGGRSATQTTHFPGAAPDPVHGEPATVTQDADRLGWGQSAPLEPPPFSSNPPVPSGLSGDVRRVDPRPDSRRLDPQSMCGVAVSDALAELATKGPKPTSRTCKEPCKLDPAPIDDTLSWNCRCRSSYDQARGDWLLTCSAYASSLYEWRCHQ